MTVSDSAGERPAARFNRHFTVDQANRTLVLVARIVSDITTHFGEYLKLRDEVGAISHDAQQSEQIESIKNRMSATIAHLNRLKTEVEAVGCVLKDWQRGLLDFPAMIDGTEVWLCWKPGETAITHWHALDEGFAARKPLEAGGVL